MKRDSSKYWFYWQTCSRRHLPRRSPQDHRAIFEEFHETFRPDGQHRRHVYPGAHRGDLRAATIEAAYARHGAAFARVGYVGSAEHSGRPQREAAAGALWSWVEGGL